VRFLGSEDATPKWNIASRQIYVDWPRGRALEWNGRWIVGDAERPLPDARRKSHGAPRGNKNAFKHGRYSAEGIERKREIAALVRKMRALARDVA
jgi:hypothetical protein